MIRDEDIASRLAAEVTEAARVRSTGGDLAGRLIAGTRRRQRATVALRTGLAVLLVALAGAGGYSLLDGRADQLTSAEQPDGAGRPDSAPRFRVSVQTAGAVTREQAARTGLDGEPQCQSDAVSAPPPAGAGVIPGLALYAAYLTDLAGYNSWSAEYSGSYESTPVNAAEGLVVICWFRGNVPPDNSAGAVPPPTHHLIAVQLTGPADRAGLRLDGRSSRPLPVLAPPIPTDSVLPADARSQQQTAYPQPTGVPIVDELTPPAQASPTRTRDCVPIGCPLEGEPAVRVELAVDGQPLDARDSRSLPAGTEVMLDLLVRVESDDEITGLYFGVAGSQGSGIGLGGQPLGIQQTLVQEPKLQGERRYRLTWTVPNDAQRHQLVVGYSHDSGHGNGPAGHSRTVGAITTANQ